MAQLKMTLADVKALVATYVAAAKQADSSWTPSSESISGLLQKITRTITIDGNFNDKLPELDGEYDEYGEAIEEYYTGLVPVLAYSDNESSSSSAEDALKPYRPTFDQVVYSTRLEKKKFKTTVDYDKYQDALSSGDEFAMLINLITKRLYDSLAVWRYNTKKQLLGTFAEKAITASAGTTYTTNSTILKAGVIYVQSSKYYISKKNYTAAVNKTLATLAAETPATVVEITPAMVKTLAVPTDTDTSEAAIKAIKEAVEDASFVSEGTSLSGSTIGAETGLVLYIKKGVMPVLEVEALAGAFNRGDLAIPATIKVVDDLGTTTNSSKIWGVLVDPRGVKLHNNYRAVREDMNGDGDYINYTLHNQDTGYISNHTFIRVFKTA